jgi:hypothetical protein
MSCHLVDPLCILRGYDQFMSLEYRSTVYFQWLYLLVNTIMDTQCILWRPYLASLDHPSIGMPALGFEICRDICWMFVCSFRQVLRVYTLARMSTKYFSYQFLSSNFILWGGNLLHIKITHFDSVTSVVITSVASVAF